MRLIDADALLPMMKYATTDSEIGVFPIKIGFEAIAKVIDDAPTVDAVPYEKVFDEWCETCKEYDREKHCCPRFNHVIRDSFKRGSWFEEQYSDTAFYVYRCSNCGSVFISRTKYCPNCGSLMNGGKEI